MLNNPIIIIDITGGTVHTVDSLLAAAVPSGASLVTSLNAELGSTVWQGGGSGTPAWGAIVGTLSSQTDLQAALDGKAASSHTQALSTISDITVTSDMVSIPKGIRPGLYDDQGTPPVGTIFESVNDGHLYWVHRDGSVHLLCDSGGYGGGAWGSITGTLSDQTDLQEALNEKQDYNSRLDSAVALWSATPDLMVFSTSGGTLGAVVVPSYFRTLMGSSDSATARAALGLTIGSNVQPYDADLAAIAGLTSAADTAVYYTGAGTAALMTVTTAARALLDDTNAAAMRTTLGLIIGTNVQAFDQALANIAQTVPASDTIAYNSGSATGTLTACTNTGRAVLGAANAAAARSAIGAVESVNATSALVSLSPSADTVVYYTGSAAAALMTVTTAARTVLDDTTVSAMVDTLGGAAATGTGGIVRAASPALTGTPTVPTAATNTSTTQAASTAFVASGLRLAATPGLRASRYYSSYCSAAVTTFQLVANRLYYFPFFCPDSTSWTRIGINVTTAVSGACRLGIYANSNGVPSGAPLLDAGTVDVSTGGEKEITISQSMAVGWYWLAIVSNVTVTLTADNISSGAMLCNVGSLSGSAGNVNHIYQAHTYAALPTPSSITGATNTTPIRIWLRNYTAPPSPTFVNSSVNKSYPSGIAAGDIIFLYLGDMGPPNLPSGFTNLGTQTNVLHERACYKVATGSESGTIASGYIVACIVVRNGDTAKIAHSFSSTLTVAASDSLVFSTIWSDGEGSNGIEIVAPSGWTRRANNSPANPGAAALTLDALRPSGSYTHSISSGGGYYSNGGSVFSIGT